MKEEKTQTDTDTKSQEQHDRCGYREAAKTYRVHVEERRKYICEESYVEEVLVIRDAPVFREHIAQGRE